MDSKPGDGLASTVEENFLVVLPSGDVRNDRLASESPQWTIPNFFSFAENPYRFIWSQIQVADGYI